MSIVDDDDGVRTALSRLLRSAGYAVRAYDSAEAYLLQASPDEPGCVVLDLKMPGIDGLTLQERMSENDLRAPIVFISGHGEVSASVRAMKHGAIDFLEKPFDDQVLLDAVDRAIELDTQRRKLRGARASAQGHLSNLTPREHQVLRCVIAGMLNKVTARELDVSEKTVKVHRGRVMRKMGARSLAHLVRIADVAGVEPAEPSAARSWPDMSQPR